MQLWHGGAPGRRVGDLLLPPSETQIAYTRRDISIEEGMANITQRSDRVYVTTDRNLARVWAGIWTPDGTQYGGGSLYRVEVEPDLLEPDDDLVLLPGLSHQVPQATVAAVYDAHVAYHPKYLTKLKRVLDDLKVAEREAKK